MDSYHRGIAGTIPGMEFLPQVLKVWQALQAQEISEAYEHYLPLCALVSLSFKGRCVFRDAKASLCSNMCSEFLFCNLPD